jgi:hypothetical protein
MHVDPRCGLHQHRTGRTQGSIDGAEVGQLVGIRTAPAHRLNLGGQWQAAAEQQAAMPHAPCGPDPRTQRGGPPDVKHIAARITKPVNPRLDRQLTGR